MQAAFFPEVGRVELAELPEPVIHRPDEVKIRVAYTGVCASDVIGLQGGHPTRRPPVVSGHETSGTVVEVGSAVKGIRPGDRVAVEPHYGCGRCPACRSGHYNLCKQKKVLGTVNWSGAFAACITAPESTLLKLPESMSLKAGALLEPLAVGLHAAKLSSPDASKTAVVLGSGAIGLSCMLGCKLLGIGTVIMIDIARFNLDLAKRLGADAVIDSRHEDAAARVLELTGGQGADIVFIAVGIPSAIMDSVSMAKIRGRVMLLAHFGNQPPALEFNAFRYKELTMTGTVMYTRVDFQDCIKATEAGKLDPAPMITSVRPIEQCVKVFDEIQQKQAPFIRVLFSF